MENPPKNEFEPEDGLRASSELLRLKLEMDYNMKFSESPDLPPEIENKWLTNIYNFEEQYRNSKPAKVKELLGFPEFRRAELLSDPEISEELARLNNLLEQKHIALDCCCKYDDRTIYKFMTEELFEHETDNFVLEGLTWHFIYEEFHPNHRYDLTRHATQLFDTLLTRKWDEEYDVYKLHKVISLKGRRLTQTTLSAMIVTFQGAHNFFEVEEIKIENVSFDIGEKTGRVDGLISYIAYPKEDTPRRFVGPCSVTFLYDGNDWDIDGFEIPGFEA